MAERRMFAKTIVLSDEFLDMPLSARCLYFTLGMLADDDGFINSPKSIMRQCGSSDDDLKLLIAKSFVLTFDSGIIVIKHWRINNYLRNDRYKETVYEEEKNLLEISKNGAYSFGIPNMGIPSIGKDSIGKDSIGKDKKPHVSAYVDDEKLNDAINNFIKMRKQMKKPMTEHAIDLFLKKLDKLAGADDDLAIQIVEKSIYKSWTDIYPLSDDFKPQQNNKIDWSKV